MHASNQKDNAPAEPTGPDEPRPHLRLVVPEILPALAERDPQLDVWMTAVARHGDRDAFTSLFNHFAPRLKGWLWRTGSSVEEAEEIAQDALVNLWRKSSQFDASRASVGSWLFTIARNLRVDRRRAIHNTWVTLDEAAADEVADAAEGQEDALGRQQHEARVRSAIAALSEDQRALVKLSFFEDMSHGRIAAEMKLPLGTVKTRLRRAATLLRGLLEECRA